MESTTAGSTHADFSLEELAHTHLADCYQCGKCTAGCPVAASMEIKPNQVIRLLQLGNAEAALHSRAIWKCVSCQTCSTRCPKNVDCAAVMDVLRQTSLEQGVAAASEQPVVEFQKAFLANIRRYGRLNELALVASYKSAMVLRAHRFAMLFADATLAPALQRRKKLHLIGESVKDRRAVEEIFELCGHKH
jgi:heterodisulfide reductase subunit C2